MDRRLLGEIFQGIKGAAKIESLLILTMAAHHLVIVPWDIWPNEFMPNAQVSGRLFKQRWQITLAV